ncbi:MAG: glycosyltransferase family 2 protein [Proteobacteria bacterium]|nr:glycosyltransferase family 2 protein [Pseudomonadota bacterium]
MKIVACLPVYNEQDKIIGLVENLIKSFELSTCNYTILLYLDGCSDSTHAKLKDNYQKNENIIIHVSLERKGKLFGLNYLARELLNYDAVDYIILLDSDIKFHDSLIAKSIQKIGDSSLLMPQISVEPLAKKNLFYRWAVVCCDVYNDLRIDAAKTNKLWFISGNFMLLNHAEVKSIFPITETDLINDDALIGWKLISRKKIVKYESSLVIYTTFPQSIHAFFKQKLRVRRGFRQLEKLNLPIAILRNKLNHKIFMEVIARKDYLLLLLLLLDNIIFILSKLSIIEKKYNKIWERIT